MPRPVAYIAQVLPASDELRQKLHEKHDVTEHEIREAVILCEVEGSAWSYDPDPQRGWRLLVTASTYRGRRLFVVLYPVDELEGIWRIGTAMDSD